MEFLLDKIDAVKNKENQELICDVVNQFKSNVVNNYRKLQKGKHFKMSLVMRKRIFAYAKTKTQISFAVTAKLISAFVFAAWIVQSLFFLNPKFHASSHLLWLYSPVCVGPGRKPRRPVFSERGSNV